MIPASEFFCFCQVYDIAYTYEDKTSPGIPDLRQGISCIRTAGTARRAFRRVSGAAMYAINFWLFFVDNEIPKTSC